MPLYCLLDLLPVELLHTVFTYFLAHEILFTFSNVSDLVDAILLAYPMWHLNLKSIRKSDFDLICRCIRPEKVISLTLSDDADTPCQSELFFRRFQIEQFTRLRSLTLVKIEFESLEAIFINLDKLKQLHSLSFNIWTITQTYSLRYNDLASRHNRIATFLAVLSNSYSLIIPQLNKLHLYDSNAVKSVPLTNLCHLKLEQCSFDALKTILENALQLKSLNIRLNLDNSNLDDSLKSSQLTRFNLTIWERPVSMNLIERFLLNFPNLQHLILNLRVFNNVIDGRRWEILTNYLKTFRFKFHVNFTLNQNDLDSFRTSFWLEEKHWYINYLNKCVFTSNQSSPIDITIDQSSLNWSTESLSNIVSNIRINEMTIKEIPTEKIAFFTHVKILHIDSHISRESIFGMVDLKQVKHLSIEVITDLLKFLPFESTMPNVRELTIRCSYRFYRIKELERYQFKQIKKLNIRTELQDKNYFFKIIFYLFPHIENLTCSSNCFSKEEMIRSIDQFPHLLNVSFLVNNLHPDIQSNVYFNANSFIKKSQRLKENNFTYRITQFISSFENSIDWWISTQSLDSSMVVQWPSGLNYVLYRIRGIISLTAEPRMIHFLKTGITQCIISTLPIPKLYFGHVLPVIRSLIKFNMIAKSIFAVVLIGITYIVILCLLYKTSEYLEHHLSSSICRNIYSICIVCYFLHIINGAPSPLFEMGGDIARYFMDPLIPIE